VGAVKLLVFDLSTMVLSVPLWEAAAFGVELTLQEDGSQAYGGSDLALRPGTEGVAGGKGRVRERRGVDQHLLRGTSCAKIS